MRRIAWLFLILMSPLLAHAGPYLNSAEPMCNGSDPSVLLCDDFEDGSWCWDGDGWDCSGFSPADPQGYGICGNGLGAGSTQCSARTGMASGTATNSGMWAMHGMSGNPALTDFYVRTYFKKSTPYVFGGEKFIMFQKRSGIQLVGSMFPWERASSKKLSLVINGESDFNRAWLHQNQGNDISIVGGRWYAVEIHIKLNDPGQSNGTVEYWLDDCGANGLGCSGTPTLRMRHVNRTIRFGGADQFVNELWFERFNNPGSDGEHFWDQIVIATRRIGWMGDTTPRQEPKYPRAPASLTITQE